MKAQIAVLYARSDSCYFDLVAQVFDIQRDARKYHGNFPVIAHPPCRSWGRLRHLAKPRPDEKSLALHALAEVRRCGGILEHPLGSSLWEYAQLPRAGEPADIYGGFTILLEQGWFGHPAPKPTYLYCVGLDKSRLPVMPVQLHRAEGRTLNLSVADREKTPFAFAQWLVAAVTSSRHSVTPTGRSSVTSTQGGNFSVTPTRLTPVTKRAQFAAWAVSQ
jgi:hypothetical protein